MKKGKIFLVLTALFTLATFNSCQDDENIIIGNNEDTLSNDSQLAIMLTDITSGNSEVSTECVAINYPVTVFGYNSSFQVENTYILNSNNELYTLLSNFSDNQYYAVDYPVTLTINGQNQITANSNSELFDALGNAIEACEPVDECDNPAVLTDGLIVYMPFSNTFDDLKGAAVTSSSSISFVEDRNGNANCAVSFQGNQEFLQVQSTAVNALVDGDKFSISLWFKVQNTAIGNLEYLYKKGAGNDGFYVGLYDMNTPLFGTSDYNLWDDPWNGNSELWEDTENWHHLVITLGDDNILKLYRDGDMQNSSDFSGTSISADAMDYFLGQWFEGYLDDLRVYNRSLSEAEVQTLYNLEGDCHTCVE